MVARSSGVVLIFASLLALGVVVLWAGQRRMIYFPFGDVPTSAAAGLPRAESVAFTTADGLTLHGWFVPAAQPATRHTVIVFNGNAGHRAMRAPLADALARRGIASLLFDYRGFGGNPGSPSEEGLALDARAARAYVAGRPDVDSTRLVYFGESLGTGVAVGLATEHPPAALILRSPFTSMVDIGRYHYPFLPVRWLLRDRFDSLDRIGSVGCPLLVIAGDRDSIIPPALSQRLYDAAPSPKRLVMIPGADHNDEDLFAGPRMIAAIVEFLQS
jgi:hypothetical protein